MNNSHLIPQIILDMVKDMKSANWDTQLNYLRRLETIQEYLNRELLMYQTQKAPRSKEGQSKR